MSGLAVLCPGQGGQHPGMLDLAAGTAGGADVLRRCAAVLGWDPLACARAGGPGAVHERGRPAARLCRRARDLGRAARRAPGAAPVPRLQPRRARRARLRRGALAGGGGAGGGAPRRAHGRRRRRPARGSSRCGGSRSRARRRSPPRRAPRSRSRTAPTTAWPAAAREALAELERRAAAAGATTVQRIPVCVPAHTRLLDAAVAPFAEVLTASSLRDAEIPVLAGHDRRCRSGRGARRSRRSRCSSPAASSGAAASPRRRRWAAPSSSSSARAARSRGWRRRRCPTPAPVRSPTFAPWMGSHVGSQARSAGGDPPATTGSRPTAPSAADARPPPPFTSLARRLRWTS